MRIHLVFNIDRLKSYYKKQFKIKRNQFKVVKEIKE